MGKKIEKDRLTLLSKVINQQDITAQLKSDYFGDTREYSPGHFLYMKEAHFIQAIGYNDKITVNDIAILLSVSHSAVSQMSRKLEEKGYIKRLKSKEDARKTCLTLTKVGKKVFEDHIEYDKGQHIEIGYELEEFSDEDLELCYRFEKRMEEIMVEKYLNIKLKNDK